MRTSTSSSDGQPDSLLMFLKLPESKMAYAFADDVLTDSVRQQLLSWPASGADELNTSLRIACFKLLRKPMVGRETFPDTDKLPALVNALAELFVQCARRQMTSMEMRQFVSNYVTAVEVSNSITKNYTKFSHAYPAAADSFSCGPPQMCDFRWSLENVIPIGTYKSHDKSQTEPKLVFKNTLTIEGECASGANPLTTNVEFVCSENGMENLLATIREVLKSAEKISQDQ